MSVLYHGFLKKKSPGIGGAWQERYFVLYSDSLAYGKAAGGKIQGRIPLQTMIMVDRDKGKKGYVFNILLHSGMDEKTHTFTLQAFDQKSLTEWLDVLQTNASGAKLGVPQIAKFKGKFWKSSENTLLKVEDSCPSPFRRRASSQSSGSRGSIGRSGSLASRGSANSANGRGSFAAPPPIAEDGDAQPPPPPGPGPLQTSFSQEGSRGPTPASTPSTATAPSPRGSASATSSPRGSLTGRKAPRPPTTCSPRSASKNPAAFSRAVFTGYGYDLKKFDPQRWWTPVMRNMKPIKRGGVKKKSPKGLKPMQLRHWYLFKHVLLYYKKPKGGHWRDISPQTEPNGFCPLSMIEKVQVTNPREGRFSIIVRVGKKNRTYDLQCKTQAICEDWVRAIIKATQVVRLDAPPGSTISVDTGTVSNSKASPASSRFKSRQPPPPGPDGGYDPSQPPPPPGPDGMAAPPPGPAPPDWDPSQPPPPGSPPVAQGRTIARPPSQPAPPPGPSGPSPEEMAAAEAARAQAEAEARAAAEAAAEAEEKRQAKLKAADEERQRRIEEARLQAEREREEREAAERAQQQLFNRRVAIMGSDDEDDDDQEMSSDDDW